MSATTFRYVHTDVFTDRPLTGNQLAVFTDARAMPAATMQAVAREMAFSETTFVLPPTDPRAQARIRIFTPRVELPFAGHPLLGSAFVLAAPLQREEVRVQTERGVFSVRFQGPSGYSGLGRMDQPVPVLVEPPPAVALCAALGLPEAGVLAPVAAYDNGPQHVIILRPDPAEVVALQPDFAALARLWSGTIMVAAPLPAQLGYPSRWKARVFVPGGGINEDPATGSAAGPLAVHLGRHGLTPYGTEIDIEQGVELGRPSRLFAVAFAREGDVVRVEVAGSCVLVARGDLRLVL